MTLTQTTFLLNFLFFSILMIPSSTTGEVIGNLIEGIADDVPSVEANVDVEQALSTAIDNEGDNAADVVFNKDDDAQLVI